MSVSENITCTSAYNSLGCSFPLLGSYTGNEREVTPLATRKSLSRVKANTKLSGFTCCLSVAFVTKKHKYFPGICDATGAALSSLPHQASASTKTRYFYTLS